MQVTTTLPLFAATLRPDRSFRATGGWLALALAAIVTTPFLIAIDGFLVPGGTALAMALLGMVIFTIRQARRGKQFQQITLWPDQLEITHVAPGRDKILQRFDPARIRLRLERDGFERTTGIFLRTDSDEVELGAFLGRDDKSSFARAFGTALRQARRSP